MINVNFFFTYEISIVNLFAADKIIQTADWDMDKQHETKNRFFSLN